MRFEELLGVNPWTALFVLANTLTVYFVAKKFLFKPVMDIIEKRQAEIDKLYADADSAKENALAMETEYQQKLAVATQTGEQLVKEAVARGQSREEEIVRLAREQAEAMRSKAEQEIAMEKKQAINDAKDELSEMAVAIATKVLGREISEADHTALVDAFIADLGDSV